MGEKPARLRLVAGDSDEPPSSDDRPPDDVLPAPSGLPHLLRGLRLVCFVSFAGGVGKTTLAVELATLIGSTARYLSEDGHEEHVRVLVIDAARFAPAAGLRLGVRGSALAHGWEHGAWRDPEAVRRSIVGPRHHASLITLPPPPRLGGSEISEKLDPDFQARSARALLDGAHAAGFSLVLADLGLANDEGHRHLIEQADLVLGVLRPSIESLPDAYRIATLVRGFGMGRKLGLVANMASDDREVREVASDAGLDMLAVIPRDTAFERAGETGEPAWQSSADVRTSLMPLARIVWPFFAERNGRHTPSVLGRLMSRGSR